MTKTIRGHANILTHDEYKRLLKVVDKSKHPERNTLLILFSFGLGLRAVEIAAIKLYQVINEDGEVIENLRLYRTKKQKPREVFLTDPRIKKALLHYVEYRKKLAEKRNQVFTLNLPLFLSQKGSSFSNVSLTLVFKNLYKSAGINASSHSGRRQFATNLIENGVDIRSIQVLMGHSNISETAKYIQENPVRLKRAIINALF